MPVIRGKIPKKPVAYTDGQKGYGGLVVNGYGHYQVFRSRNEFVRGKSCVNGTGNFWGFAKRMPARFNGSVSDKFVLHLKECGFQYNQRNGNLLPIVRKLFKNSERC